MNALRNGGVAGALRTAATPDISKDPHLEETAMYSAHALEQRCTIHVNGKPQDIPAGTSLARLLQQLGHAPAAVATAVDGTFVARAQRASCVLQAGAQVHCFQPIVGG